MTLDISDTIAPKSDQLNADDLLSGPRTYRITEVRKGTTEQPVELHLEGLDGRPYKPGKSMRRVLVAAWGSEASVYVGRRLTLYTDPTVRFGGSEVGGIRISHMSDIDKQLSVNLTVTRGRRAPFIVKPLTDAPTSNAKAVHAIHAAPDLAALDKLVQLAQERGIHDHADVARAIEARRAQLQETP